jgi:hypothetical protein
MENEAVARLGALNKPLHASDHILLGRHGRRVVIVEAADIGGLVAPLGFQVVLNVEGVIDAAIQAANLMANVVDANQQRLTIAGARRRRGSGASTELSRSRRGCRRRRRSTVAISYTCGRDTPQCRSQFGCTRNTQCYSTHTRDTKINSGQHQVNLTLVRDSDIRAAGGGRLDSTTECSKTTTAKKALASCTANGDNVLTNIATGK